MIIYIAFFVDLGTNAQFSDDSQIIRSKSAGDLVLEVCLRKAHGTLYSTNNSWSVRYSWLTVSNPSIRVVLPKDEYFCFAQMFDSAMSTATERDALALDFRLDV